MWKFKPILKSTIWGGDRIAAFKGLHSDRTDIGESWELSGVEGYESVVADGPEAGMILPDLLSNFGPAILGERNFRKYGIRFPLLIKFIDASSDLSVQVHPDDAMAIRRGMPNGKTEMWYVIKAEPEARVALGFKSPVDPADYDSHIETGDIENVLNYCDARHGDVFFIPGGRVHAICAGTFLTEIQQTSDATYRLYDYHRKGPDGKERELNTELAREAINFNDTGARASSYTDRRDIPVNVAKCPYFTTNVMVIDQEVMRDYAELDSFVVLIVTRGCGKLLCGPDAVSDVPSEMDIKQGDTILVSASAKGLSIIPDRELSLIETYVI